MDNCLLDLPAGAQTGPFPRDDLPDRDARPCCVGRSSLRLRGGIRHVGGQWKNLGIPPPGRPSASTAN
ncbi:MAG: hypothetical protein MZU91_02125 [Desulfosudis oleivorans]|nr:hypothetical protein [Desulfosudis oleivorans]